MFPPKAPPQLPCQQQKLRIFYLFFFRIPQFYGSFRADLAWTSWKSTWCELTRYGVVVLPRPLFRSGGIFWSRLSATRMCQLPNSWQEILVRENSCKLWWICQGLDEGRRPPDWVMWLCINPPKSSSMCSAHTSRTTLWLLLLKQHCWLHTLFWALTLFLEDVNMKSYLTVKHDPPLRGKTNFLGWGKAGNTLDLRGILAETSRICPPVIETFP